MGNIADKYTIEDKIDIIGGLELNSYNGTEKMQINLKDIRHSIWLGGETKCLKI